MWMMIHVVYIWMYICMYMHKSTQIDEHPKERDPPPPPQLTGAAATPNGIYMYNICNIHTHTHTHTHTHRRGCLVNA